MTGPKTDELPSETVIWHYMRFAKLVSILTEGKLFFARPFKFDDRWEGMFPPSYLRNFRRYAREQRPPLAEVAKFDEDFTKRLKKHRYGHFVNCWHISENECDAMWRLYGLAPEGVAIQSTVGSVIDCFRGPRSGAVRYYDPSTDIRSESVFGSPDILFKRSDFSWENEYRIWFDDEQTLAKIERNEEIKESELSPGRLVNISDMPELIKKLVVAPGASDSFVNSVRSVCESFNKTWLRNKVERSYADRSWNSLAR